MYPPVETSGSDLVIVMKNKMTQTTDAVVQQESI